MESLTRAVGAIVAALALFAAPLSAAETRDPAPITVLLINSYHPGFSWSDEEQIGVLERLRDELPSVDIPVEYLDAKRHPEEGNLARLKTILADKYRGKKIDLIIALDDPAVEMLTDYQTELFPDIPVVFAGISSFDAYAAKGRKRITGILEAQDIRGTIDEILTIHPNTSQILSISDMTVSGVSARREMEAVMPLYAGRVRVAFLPKCTFEEARDAVAALRPGSVILLNTYTTDGSGETLSTRDSTRLITSSASVPVYGVHRNRLGDGIVGGCLLGGREHGGKAADMGLRIIAGENPDSMAIETATSSPMFDYKQMRRFGIPLSSLPEGSVIINMPESIFTTHRELASLISIFLATLMIAVLLLAFYIVRLKQTKTALEEKTDELDRIFNLSLDLLCITSLDGRFIRMNPAWENTLGYSRDELEGKKFIDLVHPDDVDATLHEATDIVPGKNTMDLTTRYRCKDGEYRWIEWRSNPDQGAFIYSAGRDITERKQMEHSLRESESLFRTLLQAIPDLIWLKDPDGVYLACNAMFERLFGAGEKDIVGGTDYDFVDKEIADFFRENDRKAIAAGKPTRNDEWVTFADNGQRALLETIKTPMFDGKGGFIGVLGIGRDITERKNAEEEKDRLRSQLEQAQKLESVGRLAGGVAHDFNNMLSVILGYGELALTRVDPAHPVHAALREIIKAAQRSADITRQLLAFARKQTISPKPLDINKTVGGMINMLRRLIGENIDLAWSPGEPVWPVMMDPGQIDQILANLCVNARDAIADVGKVTIETGNIVFDDAYCAQNVGFIPGEYVLLAVSDSGCGMNAETLEHAFEPFFTTKAPGMGTGLGLATVYGIVRQNNGFIHAYSEPGHGTTLKIYLPRYTTAANELPERREIRSVEHGHETILLVEDEPLILGMVTLMLQDLGYTVVAAKTPREAIELASGRKAEIHLLLTDVIMPEMNGRDLARSIVSIHPGIKSLFMSGYTANVIAHHGVLDEGVHFIQKPFSKEMLGVKLRETLDADKSQG